MTIEDMYADVVKYAKYLEEMLINNTTLDDNDLQNLRMRFIKPATNVAKEWLEGETK